MSIIFVSHSHLDRDMADMVKTELEKLGTTVFVAHRDIRPTRQWQEAILDCLKKCDLFLALLTKNSENSDWTDQEAGVAIGLEKALISVGVDAAPHGFLGKFQALPWNKENAPESIKRLIQLLNEKGVLRVDTLVELLEGSASYRIAEYNLDLLKGVQLFSNEQIKRIANAVVSNRQIWQATGTKPILDALFLEYSNVIDHEVLQRWKDLRKEE